MVEMNIADCLLPQHCVRFRASSKDDALSYLAELLAKDARLPAYTDILAAIHMREEIMSTGIALGLAVPHVRLEGVPDTVMALGVLDEAVDYPSIDGGRARVVAMILSPPGHHREYLKVLAQIVRVMKDKTLRSRLEAAGEPRAIYECITSQPRQRQAG